MLTVGEFDVKSLAIGSLALGLVMASACGSTDSDGKGGGGNAGKSDASTGGAALGGGGSGGGATGGNAGVTSGGSAGATSGGSAGESGGGGSAGSAGASSGGAGGVDASAGDGGVEDASDECQPQIWCLDLDHDTFGDPLNVVSSCDPPEGGVLKTSPNCSDCNDNDSAVNPAGQCSGTPSIFPNGEPSFDFNCNGQSANTGCPSFPMAAQTCPLPKNGSCDGSGYLPTTLVDGGPLTYCGSTKYQICSYYLELKPDGTWGAKCDPLPQAGHPPVQCL